MGKYGLLIDPYIININSPLNLILLFISLILIYNIYKEIKKKNKIRNANLNYVPCLKKQDMTLRQLHIHDGTNGKSILIAVNGKIFDVTPRKDYYGPQGPYSIFAGRDATRGLAKFSLAEITDTPRDLSDLSVLEMESVREWELQFTEKYFCVGRLIGENDEPNDYSASDNATENGQQQTPFLNCQDSSISLFDRFKPSDPLNCSSQTVSDESIRLPNGSNTCWTVKNDLVCNGGCDYRKKLVTISSPAEPVSVIDNVDINFDPTLPTNQYDIVKQNTKKNF